ncbi:hypothetical protein ACVMYR_09915 [Micromonospora sp. PTRAS2]
MPIDFVPQNFGGGEQNPAIYRDFQTYPGIEVPTACLRAEFNRYFTYDAVSQTLTERTNFGQCSDASYFSWTPPNRGGVIIANADLTKTMAVYGANTSQGGSVSEKRFNSWVMTGSVGQIQGWMNTRRSWRGGVTVA